MAARPSHKTFAQFQRGFAAVAGLIPNSVDVISAKPAGCSRQTHLQRREQGAGKERRQDVARLLPPAGSQRLLYIRLLS